MPSPERPGRVLAAAFGSAIVALLLAYPFVTGLMLTRAGVHATAGALLALAAISLALPVPQVAGARLAIWPRAAIAGLLLLAALSGREVFLLLVPSVIYLALAVLCESSLSAGGSLVESVVRRALPAAPDFIGGYCRKLTRLWAAFFLGCALALAALALRGNRAIWEACAGWGLYALMAVLTGVEFLVRKTWFRYYFRGGPFDRVWSRLFPAERTPQGRRSLESIRRYREQA